MAKSRKKSISQKVVNTATIGMPLPKPAKKILGSRMVALLIVVSIPVLLSTGMVTVQWENGRPRLSINRQRTAEVREEATEQLEEFRESHGGQGALANWQPGDQLEQRVSEPLSEAKEKLVGDGKQAWNGELAKSPAPRKEKQASRPFRDLGQKAKGLFR